MEWNVEMAVPFIWGYREKIPSISTGDAETIKVFVCSKKALDGLKRNEKSLLPLYAFL